MDNVITSSENMTHAFIHYHHKFPFKSLMDEAYRSRHWPRAAVHPGLEADLSRGSRRDKQPLTHTHLEKI